MVLINGKDWTVNLHSYLGESEICFTEGKKPNPKKDKQNTDLWLPDIQVGLERAIDRKEDGQTTF